MLREMRVALKEWAVVCEELAAGRQIVILRKGGIRETGPGFTLEHRELFLFPTYVHENADELAPGPRARLADVTAAAPPAGVVRLALYAEVTAADAIDDLERLRALDGRQALAWPAVERRFHYRRPGLHVVTLRVHRLAHPVVVPNLSRYDGCRSWVALEDGVALADARPVLDDASFAREVAAVRGALGFTPASAPRDSA